MSIKCPKCESGNLRYSRSRNAAEKVKSWIGMHPLRCRDCHTRFVGRTWKFSEIPYSRCPRCYRTDLATWNERQFSAPNYMILLLRLGGNPYRCEYCRYNFVSFRQRKEKYSAAKRRREMEPLRPPVSRQPESEQIPRTGAPSEQALPVRVKPAPREMPISLADRSAPGSAAEAIAWRKARELERQTGQPATQ